MLNKMWVHAHALNEQRDIEAAVESLCDKVLAIKKPGKPDLYQITGRGMEMITTMQVIVQKVAENTLLL